MWVCRGFSGGGGRISPGGWGAGGGGTANSPQHNTAPINGDIGTFILSFCQNPPSATRGRLATVHHTKHLEALLVSRGPYFAFTLVRIAAAVPIARGVRFRKNATRRKESQGSTGDPGPDPPVRPSQEVKATLTVGGDLW